MFRKKSNFKLLFKTLFTSSKNGVGWKLSSQLNHIRRRSVKKKNHLESAAIHFPNQSCISTITIYKTADVFNHFMCIVIFDILIFYFHTTMLM